METVQRVFLDLLPLIVSNLFTFYLTKYTWHKNRPLDKAEIAYNRIYYPLYCFVRNQKFKEIDQEQFQKKITYIFMKYDKYLNSITRYTYHEYEKIYKRAFSKQNRMIKNRYKLFRRNIIKTSEALRIQLGYPQANFFDCLIYFFKEDLLLASSTICYLLFVVLVKISAYIQWGFIKPLATILAFFVLIALIVLIITEVYKGLFYLKCYLHKD